MFLVLLSVDFWVGGNRFTVGLNLVNDLFCRQILGSRRIIFGFGLFVVRLFLYLRFIGVYSIFPYIFCLTAHFSHNFSVSIVLWFSTLILNTLVRLKRFRSHFVPRGLS